MKHDKAFFSFELFITLQLGRVGSFELALS